MLGDAMLWAQGRHIRTCSHKERPLRRGQSAPSSKAAL